MLKAYIVHDGEEGENACLVFAPTNAKARQTGHGFNDLGCDYGYFSLRAHRSPEADRLLVPERTEPYIETRGDLLRSLGWTWEDDSHRDY